MKGVPSYEITKSILPEKVSISPEQFRGIKPKLVVSEGDKVETGSPLFFDKLKPKVKWASPSSGVVTNIQYGDRRVLGRSKYNDRRMFISTQPLAHGHTT